jgi:phytanoyl-CoA hydroxylase
MSAAAAAAASTASEQQSHPQSYLHGLTAAQLAQFHTDGYLLLPDFFTAAEADHLKQHADRLLEEFDLATHPRTIFKTAVDGPQTAASAATDANKYFLDSADKVHFFFEEHAFDSEGKLTVEKGKAINKIGHYLHELDPEFKQFTYKPEVKALARSLSFQQPVVLQSMVITKQPRIGGVVDAHRDSTFLHTEPSTATGLWFALEDCTSTNGCLEFVPGSHKDGKSDKRFDRKNTDSAPLRASLNNPEYDPNQPEKSGGPNNAGVELVFSGADTSSYPKEAWKLGEVKKGTLVLINGDVVHASTANRSEKSRYIYTFHMIDVEGTTYPTSNWLQSTKKFPVLE